MTSPAYTVRHADNSVLWCSDWSQVADIPGAWQDEAGVWHAPRQEPSRLPKPRMPAPPADPPVDVYGRTAKYLDNYNGERKR